MKRDEARRVLGVAPGDFPVDIEQAFKTRVRSLHPNSRGDAEQYARFNDARKTLLAQPIAVAAPVRPQRPARVVTKRWWKRLKRS